MITLITCCFNDCENLRVTLESVRKNKVDNLQYIIIDGGSSDNTKGLIKDFSDVVDICVSEADEGVYDAINKGIGLASGDYIGLLHAGTLLCVSTLDLVSDISQKDGSQSIIAGSAALRHRGNKKFYYRSKIKPLGPDNTQVLHETIYVPKKYYTSLGKYDTSFRISADFSWFSRAIKLGVPVIYSDEVFVDYIEGWGMSGEPRNFMEKINNHFAVMRRDIGLGFATMRYMSRLIRYPVSRFITKIKDK